jgi:hypothetical protein
MGKSISPMLFLKSGTKLIPAPPRSHRSDEFAAGYSSAVCSPAWPASASPDGLHLPQPEVICQSVSFGRISKLDSKARTRQTINIGVGPNQSIEVGPDRLRSLAAALISSHSNWNWLLFKVGSLIVSGGFRRSDSWTPLVQAPFPRIRLRPMRDKSGNAR